MKKKFTFRALALLLPAILLFGLLPFTSVADVVDTIDNTAPRTLTITKLLKDGDGIPNTTGTELTGGSKPTNDPIDGITFKAYAASRVSDATYTQGPVVVDGVNYYYKPTAARTGVTGTTNEVTGTPVEGVIRWAFGTGASGLYNQEDGRYIIFEEADGMHKPIQPFVVDIPMITPTTGTVEGPSVSWLYDIFVYPKNETSTINFTKSLVIGGADKKVSSGDTVTWKLELEVPSADILAGWDTSKDIIISDPLNANMTYVASTLAIDAGGANWITSKPVGVTVTDSASLIKIVIPYADFLALADKTVTVTFNTKIVSGFDALSIPNTATFEYFLHGIATAETSTDNADLIYGAIVITKKDATTGALLQNVEFEIYKADKSTKIGTGTTNASGQLTFSGLLFDIDTTTKMPLDTVYYLKETVTNSGYNLLKDMIAVTIKPNTNYSGLLGDYASYTAQQEVLNKKGFTLPITGGAGVVMFSIIGACLMGGSVIILAASKKKKNANGTETEEII